MCGCLCTARGAEAKVRKRKKKEEVRCEITSGRFRRIYSSCVVRCNPHNTIRTDSKTSGRRRQRGIVWKSAHRVKRGGGGERAARVASCSHVLKRLFMCAADHQLFETQCTRVSLPSVTTFLSALHVSRRHAQLPEEAEFCSPCFVFASCVSQPSCYSFLFSFFFVFFFRKANYSTVVWNKIRGIQSGKTVTLFFFFFSLF